MGPKPLDHSPDSCNAPEMGIPVSAAIPFAADTIPNLQRQINSKTVVRTSRQGV
jgi:hypothetical protein